MLIPKKEKEKEEPLQDCKRASMPMHVHMHTHTGIGN